MDATTPCPSHPLPLKAATPHALLTLSSLREFLSGLLSLGLDQRIDARFGDQHVLAVHLHHHKPVLVQGDQAPPLGLRLPPSIGIHYQVYSAKHECPFPSPAQRATPVPTYGSECRACVCQFSVY